MSFYDDASLVVIPSGYKTSKVYAEKPTDGSGDLAFTRTGDTATRVNSAGLIEKVRTNLALYSEQFDNAAWTAVSCTVSANIAISPDGTQNADRIATTAANSFFGAAAAVTISANASTYTQSVFAKWVSGSEVVKLRAALTGGTSVAKETSINIRTGVVISTDTTAQVVSYGNGWYRISHQATNNSTNTNFVYQFYPTNDGSNTNVIYLWGAQLELSDFGATAYIPTTTAAVSVGPVANVPRLDYLGSSCPRLLLEPQRTNWLTYSEQLNNAAWSVLDNVSVSANVSATLDPSGYNGADKLVENSANDQHRIYRSIGGTGATFSFFAKAAERSWIGVLSNNGNFTYFNIGNGTLGTVAATSTAKITPYGNGWYRCEIYNTHPSFGSLIQLMTGNNGTSYLGDGTSGAYIWGCQVEDSATYATSYIPTLAASATRGADVALKGGISSLIGQQEGVIYWEGILPSNTEGGSSLAANIINSDRNINSNSGYSINYVPSTQGITFSFFIGNGTFVPDVNLGNNLFAPGTYVKIAAAYKSGSSALVVNGGSPAVSTASFTSTTSISALWLNDVNVYFGYPTNLQTKAIALFPTRLTNAQLTELTTL